MMVKDTAGNDFNAASNGKANAGVALGVVGTTLGALSALGNLSENCNNGTGLLGGLFGRSNDCGTVVPFPVAAPVTEHQYYEDTIANFRDFYIDSSAKERRYYEDSIQNQKDFFSYAQGVSQRICDLEQRVAVDETSIAKNFEYMAAQNDWQNRFFDEKMRYADLLEQCRIEQATCKCIKGEVYASPSNLADPYVGRTMVLGSYVAPLNSCDGWNTFSNGCGWSGWGNGCGCGWGF